ncbi:signal transduction histidine kinase [Longilinea arvoryzae]|uniref:histidine kinase n=1 Tax=Longilinea arvoryzae TaxID=360412 RepID=A0A0S7BJK4_9CHLR|nr:sensor histidine kinase [Longilinea arvoryzae]GAP14662.1 signal transduction histidine kinase [Longilinea arvoryzae]
MNTVSRPIKVGTNADLAFAVVVLASYFATFSSIRRTSAIELILMIGFGVAYILIGIYGYASARESSRFKYQLAYFVIQIPLGCLIIYLGKGAAYNALLLLPLMAHAVILLSPRLANIVGGVILVGYVVAIRAFSPDWTMVWNGLPTFLAGLVFITVFTQSAVSEERARAEVERLVGELTTANQQLRAYAVQVEELAIAKERNRLAREIHDGLGHYLTTIHMQIQASKAIMAKDPQKAMDALDKALDMTHQALADVRRSVAALRSPAMLDLTLSDMLAELVENVKSGGMKAELEIEGEPRTLSPQARLTLYRSAQEALNNSLKHSQATKLSVLLDFQTKDRVSLRIEDNGLGTDQLDGGFGLIGMKERVHMLDGDIQIQTAKGRGFRVEIRLPG